VATQTDNRTKTVDATIQTDDIQNPLGQTVSYSSITTQADAMHLMSPMPGLYVVQYLLEIFYSLKLEIVWKE